MKFIFLGIILVFNFFAEISSSASAEELYPELDCPSRTPIIIAGTVIGAALVYEITVPTLTQQNGINFVTAIAVGGLAGGFAGAVYAQKSCQSKVTVTSHSLNLCYDF